MHYIKNILLKIIIIAQKQKIEVSIRKLSTDIATVAKFHPHLHYYSSNIYLLLCLLSTFHKQHKKAHEYYELSSFHDPQYSLVKHIKATIFQTKIISVEQIKKITSYSIKLTRLISHFDHIQLSYPQPFKKNLAYYTANRHFHLNNLSTTIQILHEYIQDNTKNSSAFCDLGRALLHKKQFKDAIPFLEKSIALNPVNFMAYLWLGVIYIFLSDFKEANRNLLTALNIINTEHDNYHKNFSNYYYARGKLYYKIQETELSLNDLNKSLDLHNKNINSLLLRAKILLSKHNFIDTLLDLEQIERTSPHNKHAKKLKIFLKKITKNSQDFS
jgi:tetratricopeptide (TPR) repeat protein